MRTPYIVAMPALAGRETLRRTLRHLRSAGPYRWRYTGTMPERVIAVPDLLIPADPLEAEEIYAGQFTLSGRTLSSGSESPFSMRVQDRDWLDELHGFRWLRHLKAADTQLARANAKALIADWINGCGNQMGSAAWQADVMAARLISWLAAAPLIVDDASPADYRTFMKSIARQMRYLHHNLGLLRDGYPRLSASIALAYCSLCIAGREKVIRAAVRDLDRELSRQILPDGVHISRNPVLLLKILADLLPLRTLFGRQGQTPPANMQSAIDKMVGAVRFFQHSNDALAQFNGTGATPQELLEAILSAAGGSKTTARSAPSAGYERLSAGRTVVLIDTGRPESRMTARHAMAGTLSFELSNGRTRFITNCGVPETGQTAYAPYYRATAAHSTATIADTSSSRYAGSAGLRNLLPSPLIHAPDIVTVLRDTVDDFDRVVASHDGYQRRFGITHERHLLLDSEGKILNGIDRFVSEPGDKASCQDFCIRFHLTPEISTSFLSSGRSIMLAAPDGNAWTFSCIDAPMTIEESIHFSGSDHPRKAEQIVVAGNTREQTEIRWSFNLREKRRPSRGRGKIASEQYAPDLLDSLEAAGDGD